MSNVTLFRDEKNVASGAPQGIDEVTRRLLGNASNLKRLSIRGGKWRVMMGGEQVAVSPNETLDVVVINAAPHVSRYWYNKGYDGKTIGAPDCWSNDGVTPDAKALSPQYKSCDGCPKNIAGSGANGQGRACRYARRLAVVLASESGIGEDVHQVQLPPTSMFGKAKDEEHMPLDAYVKHLAGHNYSITGVVTQMRFDPGTQFPCVYFSGVRRLEADERAIVVEKGQSQEALQAIAFNPSYVDTSSNIARPVSSAPKVEEKAESPAPTEAAPESSDSEPTVRQSKPRVTVAPKTAVDPATLIDEWELDD